MNLLVSENLNLSSNLNNLSTRGRKSSVQRYFKKELGTTINEYIVNKYPKETLKPITCSICNEISSNATYDFYLDCNDLYITFVDVLSKSYVLCCGTESNKAAECKKKRKGLNPNSVEFVKLVHKVTSSKAREIINERNSSPFYRSNYSSDEEYARYQRRDKEWFKHNKTEDDYDKYRKKLKYTHSEQYYIDKLGVNKGKKKWKELSEKKASCNLAAKIDRYGKDAGEKLYQNHLGKVAHSEETFVSRHGKEIGLLKWKEYQENSPFYNKKQNKMCIEYWISKGVENPEDARQEFIKTRPTFSKQYCIDKYGVTEGMIRWKEYCKKQCNSLSRGQASAESLENFYNKLIEHLPLGTNYYIGAYGKHEYFIMDSEYGYKLYDFTIPSIGVIIEYHGSLWHYNKDKLMESPYRTLNERKKTDELKQHIAEKAGFEYYVVFDTDNFDEKVNTLAAMIKERMNVTD